MLVPAYQQPYKLITALEDARIPLETPTLVTVGNLFVGQDGAVMFCQSVVTNHGQQVPWPVGFRDVAFDKDVFLTGTLPELVPFGTYELRNALVLVNGRVELKITPQSQLVLVR